EAVDTLAVRGATDREVRGLSLDSRHVSPGEAFFALPGVHADGARFAAAAVEAGAIAVFGGAGLEALPGTVVEVAEPRLALAQAAVRFNGHPSRELGVVAVTGTNGKTTTTWLVEAMFTAWGRRAGLIGTTGVRVAGELSPSPFTTPESPELQGLIAGMRTAGVTLVALEASSHARVQRRTWGLACDACVFTNLTQDHLDYHGTMDAYLDAKLMLFDGRNGGREKPCVAVVNADDRHAARVAEAAAEGGMRTAFFGSPEAVGERDGVAIARLEPRRDGLALALVERTGANVTERPCTLPMLGRYNAWNAAAALAAARALGVDGGSAVRALERFAGVPGRLERVDAGQRFAVAVDYAHTPDALERALAACREHAEARVLLVFGCGGDRDRGKRPLMGAAAARAADRAWVTNDNPRSEDPKTIADAILAGVPQGTTASFEVVLDRRAAIAAALGAAGPGDLVLIAGKGHETTQTTAGVVTPFDDRQVARELLRAAAGGGRPTRAGVR
ncbi:MAG TPA: UDP-N-acetylmuramoyl-L-alanyl-D-glutamate--2,6-diaminopimelate ligase, partial [Methylomirabilota bacterium]|nr:UDP-N-acetylmuramoyl-L-alanyl-D-glutamate--2,6-diaminopimelate ligase [Methylomirabilota bacterium]